MSEHVLVVGAGIAGLGSALALHQQGFQVTVLDRDPPPPDTSPDAAFDVWERKGVGHLRHSHAFLAALYQLIRDNYPDLLARLNEAGVRNLRFADGLPVTLQKDYRPVPSDEDLTILTSRRTTLEYVIRQYAGGLDGVTFETDTLIRDIIVDEMADGRMAVRGVVAEKDGERTERRADVVIDAGGKNSQLIPWLEKRGLKVRREAADAGIVYYTRHYKRHPGVPEPERGTIPGAGDLGYIKYGVFPADNDCFSITLAVPEIETELRTEIVRPEVFDQICAQLPGIAKWTSPETAEPRSKVFGMGKLRSRWLYLLNDEGHAQALNFFAVGDALIRTNPLYGRGCSFGFIAAHELASILRETKDANERARRYEAAVLAEIRPYYDSMVKQDLAAIRRAQNERTPGYSPSLKARIVKSFAEDAIVPALRADIDLMRAFMKGFHMLEDPGLWLKDPRNLIKLLRIWARGKKRNAGFYPPKLGPERAEMFSLIGVKAA